MTLAEDLARADGSITALTAELEALDQQQSANEQVAKAIDFIWQLPG